MTDSQAQALATRILRRLEGPPSPPEHALPDAHGETDAAAALATYALGASGRRQAHRRDARRLRTTVVRFALAAALAVATVTTACNEAEDTGPQATATAVQALSTANAGDATVTAPARGSAARFQNLLLLGTDPKGWAVMVPQGADTSNATPIIVDARNAGLTSPGAIYEVAAQPIPVGTRDGASQFLSPLQPATQSAAQGYGAPSTFLATLQTRWSSDERFAAPMRAISGQLTMLDAAYNADAAVNAGGTHTYTDGVVLNVDPDNPALQVIDRTLLMSGRPTRPEDLVTVAVRQSEKVLYEPGQIVTLQDVVMDKQQTTVNDQPLTVYVANAALQGAHVNPTGQVDLQGILNGRLQQTNQTLAAEAQLPAASGTPFAAGTTVPTATARAQSGQQTVIVQDHYRGPSFLDDYLMWMWLSNSSYYRGPSVIIASPPAPTNSPSSTYYYAPPPAAPSSAPISSQTNGGSSQSTAIQAARSAVSGQASGTGGGVAATNKAAADATARVSAATSKASSVAGSVSASSSGKSTSSAPKSSSSVASRSVGSTSSSLAGKSSSSGSSSSSIGGKSSSGSSSIGSSSGFGSSGSKGVGGSSSSSS